MPAAIHDTIRRIVGPGSLENQKNAMSFAQSVKASIPIGSNSMDAVIGPTFQGPRMRLPLKIDHEYRTATFALIELGWYAVMPYISITSIRRDDEFMRIIGKFDLRDFRPGLQVVEAEAMCELLNGDERTLNFGHEFLPNMFDAEGSFQTARMKRFSGDIEIERSLPTESRTLATRTGTSSRRRDAAYPSPLRWPLKRRGLSIIDCAGYLTPRSNDGCTGPAAAQ
jgi:hypothetical protein